MTKRVHGSKYDSCIHYTTATYDTHCTNYVVYIAPTRIRTLHCIYDDYTHGTKYYIRVHCTVTMIVTYIAPTRYIHCTVTLIIAHVAPTMILTLHCSSLPILFLSGVDRHDCLSPCFSVLCELWIELVLFQIGPHFFHPPQSGSSSKSLPSHFHRCYSLCNIRAS